MAAPFHFEHVVDFSPTQADAILRTIPAKPGVFALCGPHPEDAPYLTHTTDIRRRTRRLLDPPESQSKRLNLREKVARIEYTLTGSRFESSLVLYDATAAHFGHAEARRRLKLHTPYFLRLTIENEFPRVYATNKLSKRGLAQMYGPFPSRAAAERYCDAALDLFKLRRCSEDLAPYPEHPGCIYGEMGRCIEPCKQACTAEQYAAETAAVKKFFDTRGESMIIDIGLAREEASSGMHFEKAAALHAQWQKVKSVQSFADWIVRPIPRLRAIIVQPVATRPPAPDETPEASEIHLEEAALFSPRRRLSPRSASPVHPRRPSRPRADQRRQLPLRATLDAAGRPSRWRPHRPHKLSRGPRRARHRHTRAARRQTHRPSRSSATTSRSSAAGTTVPKSNASAKSSSSTKTAPGPSARSSAEPHARPSATPDPWPKPTAKPPNPPPKNSKPKSSTKAAQTSNAPCTSHLKAGQTGHG
ncbi:MAG: hypothetical protein WDN23_20025 [Edaphobacter sp.]